MKDACRKRGVGFAACKHIGKVRHGARTAGRDNRNAHRFTHRRGQLAVESGPRAVGVHGGQQNFAGPALFSLAAGLLVGVGGLTRYSFLCVILPVVAFLLVFGGPRRWVYCVGTFVMVALVGRVR